MTQETTGILGTGIYLPKNKKYYGEKKEFTYHESAKNEDEFFMAIRAIESAMADAKLTSDKIGLVIYCRSINHYKNYLSFSTMLIEKLKAENAYGFDLHTGLMGGLVGMHLADKIIRGNSAAYSAIVVASHKYDSDSNVSRTAFPILFGDGAAAVILSKENLLNKVISSNFVMDHYHEFVKSINPENKKGLLEKIGFLKTIRQFNYNNLSASFSLRLANNLVRAIKSSLISINLDTKDVNYFCQTAIFEKQRELVSSMLSLSDMKTYNFINENGHLANADTLANIHMILKNHEHKDLDILVAGATDYDGSAGSIVIRK